ncbi:voltage-gated potassium channel [Aureococcus anophagefferens]|uniref:Voltage-gated potassium channel n=1 Tax=Aureococcus anophagefferens TaxID=44056 RepID=A0ABR1GF95_AURAN
MRQKQWPQLLLLPNSWVVQYWSLFILILVVVQSVVVPVEATFDDVTVFKGALEWASTAAFGCDLFFQFLFATTDDHEKIIADGRRHRAALRHLKVVLARPRVLRALRGDLHAFDDKNVKSATKNTGLIKALKLLRLFRLSKIMKKLEKRTQGGVQFTKLLFAVMLSVHWIACGWKGIDDVWRCGDGNARACISINGDGRAITNREQVFFAFVVIYGSIMQAAIFGKMAGLLHRLDEAHQNYQTKLITVQKRVGYMGLPPDLQDRILRYYEQLWEKDRSRIPFMQRITRNMLEHLVMQMKPTIYMESESMMRKHDIGDWMAFAERHARGARPGLPAVADPEAHARGDHVGERALLDQTPRSATVIALVWTTVNACSRAATGTGRGAFPAEAERVQQDLVSHSSRKAKPRLEDGDAEEKADRRSRVPAPRPGAARTSRTSAGRRRATALTQQRKVAAEVK